MAASLDGGNKHKTCDTQQEMIEAEANSQHSSATVIKYSP